MQDPFIVWLLVLGDIALALAVGWTTWAGARGRLRRNTLAGIRTSATMASDEAWVAGHRAAWPLARALAALAGVCAVLALLLVIVGQVGAGLVVGLAPMVAVLLAAFPMVRLAGRAARASEV